MIFGLLTFLAGILMWNHLASCDAFDQTGGDQLVLPSVSPCNQSLSVSGEFILMNVMQEGLCIITLNRSSSLGTFSSLHFTTVTLDADDTLKFFDGNYNYTNSSVVNITGSRDWFVVVMHANVSYVILNITTISSSSSLSFTYSTSDCQLNLPIASELVGAPGVYLTAPYYLPMESEFQCIYTLKFAADADASKAMVLSFLSVDLANSVIHVKSSSQENVFDVSGTSPVQDVFSNGSMSLTLVVKKGYPRQRFSATLAVVTYGPGHVYLSSGKDVSIRLVSRLTDNATFLLLHVTELDTVNKFSGPSRINITSSAGVQYFLLQSNESTESKTVFELDKEAEPSGSVYSVDVYRGRQVLAHNLLATFRSKDRAPVVADGDMLVVASLKEKGAILNGSFTYSTYGNILLELGSVSMNNNSYLAIYEGTKAWRALPLRNLTANSDLRTSRAPLIALNASHWNQLEFGRGDSQGEDPVNIQVSYRLDGSVCGGVLVNTSYGYLHSPHYPAYYPLNSICAWTFPATTLNQSIMFHFTAFCLADNHSLVVSDNISTAVRNYSRDMMPADYLVAGNVTVTVTFSAPLVKVQSALGFAIDYYVVNCGGTYNMSSGSVSTPSYPKLVNSNVTCVWIISLPASPPSEHTAANIVNLTISANSSRVDQLNKMVTIYDGPRMNASLLPLNLSAPILSLTNTVIIVYNGSAASSPGLNLSALHISYNTSTCLADFQCGNGICLHTDWLCNGCNDCGDNTDELNCTHTPSPAAHVGVATFKVVILFFVGLLLGVVMAFILPALVRRRRTNQYSTFENSSVVA